VLRLALRTARTRKAGFVGSLLAVVLAVTVITTGGFLLQSALTGDGGAERFHAATLVGSPRGRPSRRTGGRRT
jgi:putative ABC transport system permease protein